MQQYTYTELKTKIENDLDLIDEVFVSEEELIGYINEAIDDAETAIHSLNCEDKYFLSTGTFSWVSGTADYVLPTDIYGVKFRLIFYNDGTTKYPIEKVRNLEGTQYFVAGDYYQYLVINNTATGFQLRFFPTPAETSTNAKIHYIRNMKRVTNSAAATNICEIPECGNFVFQHVKKSYAKKTRRPDMIQMEDMDLKIQYQLMLDALKDMTLDQNTLILPDVQSYYDQEGWVW